VLYITNLAAIFASAAEDPRDNGIAWLDQ